MYCYAVVAAIAVYLCKVHTSVLRLSKQETSVQDSANYQRGNNILYFFLSFFL